MDFLRRLFRGGQEPEPGQEADTDVDDIAATSELAAADAGAEASGMSWKKVATDPGRSEYAGMIDGVRVATVAKRPSGSGRDDAWEWRLDVPGGAAVNGSARTLKEAKPAAERAFGDEAH